MANTRLRPEALRARGLLEIGQRAVGVAALGLLALDCSPSATQAHPPRSPESSAEVVESPCASSVPLVWAPPDPSLSAPFRDSRKNAVHPRDRALLINELQGLEAMFKRGVASEPSDEMKWLRRLAEGHVELARSALRDQTALRRLDRASEAASAEEIVIAAQRSAIQYFTVLKGKYPSYPKLDEVLYYLAYEYELVHDYDNARKLYRELVETAPRSRYIPNAHLALGELFFVEAPRDPSEWELARAAYEEVVRYPAPENKTFGYAHYKLGFVFLSTGDLSNARREFGLVIEHSNQFADAPNAARLAEAARNATQSIDTEVNSRPCRSK